MTKAPAPFSGCIGPASILLLIGASGRFYSCLSGANRLLLRLLVPLLARPPVGPAALHLALLRHTRRLRTLIPRLPTGRQFSCARFCSLAFSLASRKKLPYPYVGAANESEWTGRSSIHRIADTRSSRKPGFQYATFSEVGGSLVSRCASGSAPSLPSTLRPDRRIRLWARRSD